MSKFPRVIIHNSISLDDSLTGFEVNIGLHYRIAGEYKADAHLIGSVTAKTGIEMYGSVPEADSDFKKPKRDRALPYWVIIDTSGTLNGLLHNLRRFEYCRDIIILVSEMTLEPYLDYLKERDYDFHIAGKDKADLKKALMLLHDKYKIKKILTDTGRVLGNLLLDQGLASEISLLVHPVIVGKDSYRMFGDAEISLELKKSKVVENDYVHLVYGPSAAVKTN